MKVDNLIQVGYIKGQLDLLKELQGFAKEKLEELETLSYNLEKGKKI